MYIQSLSLTGFRNLLTQKLSLSPGLNILYGPNGAGKTNVLEAVFTLCLGRSPRGAADTTLLQVAGDVYRLEGEVQGEHGSHTVAVAYQRGGRRKVVVDDLPSKTSELYHHFCAVSVGPEDHDIMAGPPSVRRQFLDIYLSQLSKSYLASLVEYQKSLAHKNAGLKAGMDVSPFEPLLVAAGARVMHVRKELLASLVGPACDYYEQISGDEKLTITYKPSVGLANGHCSFDDIKTAFLITLEDNFERERITRNALIGPHRDDVLFEIAGYPARTHASQGQWRTAALSIKLAIYHLLKEKRKMSPIILLDEIFAELDDNRNRSLTKLFGDFSQLFLTTAQEPPSHLKDKAQIFSVNGGRVEEKY